MRITPLISWDFVHVGACKWTDDRQRIPCDTPSGIELKVEPATKSDPIIPGDCAWEKNGDKGSLIVLRDGDKYKIWYGINGHGEDGGSVFGDEKRALLCYADSDDGMNWRKPELGLIEVDGSAANNVVMVGTGIDNGCVFIDPTAPPDARYKCMYFKGWFEGEPGEVLTPEEGMRRVEIKIKAKEGDEVPPLRGAGALFGLTSPDGLRWIAIEKPVQDKWHDTHNIVDWDETRGKYVAYLRGFYGGRRAVSHVETDDFENWPDDRLLCCLNTNDDPADSLYSNCYTKYPDRPEIHLMFPSIYHQREDTVDAHLAVSLDGIVWARHNEQSIISRGKAGAPDEGFLYPDPHLLRFSKDGKFRIMCVSGAEYHNEGYNRTLDQRPRNNFYQWAEWQEDRLAGIHAKDQGEFTINMQPCGERMLANFRTEPGGSVRFELVDNLTWPPEEREGYEGHRFDDMQPLSGDETHAAIAWNGSADLSAFKDKEVAVRVRLNKAALFSITMYGTDEPLLKEDPRYPL